MKRYPSISKPDKHRKRLVSLGLLSLLFVAGCLPEKEKAFPQNQLTIESAPIPESIQIGDPIELTITAYFPTNGVLSIPELGRKKDIIVLNQEQEKIERTDGLIQVNTQVSITSFRLGNHALTTAPITCQLGETTLSVPFPETTIQVTSSLTAEDENKMADIQPVHQLPGHIPNWLWIALGTALLAFIIGLITSKLWKHRETLIPPPPPIPPHVIALKALKELKEKELLEQNLCNPFYTELSLILRTYLEGRFKLNAPDETTEEIVEELSTSTDLSGAQQNMLKAFMRQADLVKFAKGVPDRTTMEEAFETTKSFVNETLETTSDD